MARLGKLIKGTRYQIGRFAGAWYVVNLDKMKFVYGPFIRESTAIARLEKLAGRINPRRRKIGTLPTPRRSRYSQFRINHKYGKFVYDIKTHDGQTFRFYKLSEAKRGILRHPGSILDKHRILEPRGRVVSPAKRNPIKGALIYGRVLKIFARKTTGPYKGQDFVHTFKKGAIMVGMPDGSLRITHP